MRRAIFGLSALALSSCGGEEPIPVRVSLNVANEACPADQETCGEHVVGQGLEFWGTSDALQIYADPLRADGTSTVLEISLMPGQLDEVRYSEQADGKRFLGHVSSPELELEGRSDRPGTAAGR